MMAARRTLYHNHKLLSQLLSSTSTCQTPQLTTRGRGVGGLARPGRGNLQYTQISRGISCSVRSQTENEVSERCEDVQISHDRPARLHVPVMVDEVLHHLQPADGQTILDMTFGGGGHTRAIFHEAPTCHVFGLDRDPTAHSIAQKLAQQNPHFTPLLGRFSEVHHLLAAHGVMKGSIDGVLFDVGASSLQFDEAGRGFSLSQNGPLDMRMDANRDVTVPTAADLVNHLDESSLCHVIKRYGEERRARLIARAIIDTRHTYGKITRTKQLADIVSTVYHDAPTHDKLQRFAHPATRTFQALRIFVNNELNELHNGLELVWELLRPGGVCVVLAFHSLEDRIAKRHFHGIDMDMRANLSLSAQSRANRVAWREEETGHRMMRRRWTPVSRKVTTPGEEEGGRNPRARSAKLRAAHKIQT